MYICICKGITDKQIRKAAIAGVDNLYDLRVHLGVTSGCGSCADQAQSILTAYSIK
jgi:bacterioferritin-associated ferredoxin